MSIVALPLVSTDIANQLKKHDEKLKDCPFRFGWSIEQQQIIAEIEKKKNLTGKKKK